MGSVKWGTSPVVAIVSFYIVVVVVVVVVVAVVVAVAESFVKPELFKPVAVVF